MAKKKIQKNEILTEEILRLRLTPIEQYSSITVGAAEMLAIKGAHKFDDYDDYHAFSLDWLTELPDDAALKLGKSKAYYDLSLNGLNSLSDKAAEALSKFIGEKLYLNGLTALSENGARALAKFKGKKLSLNGLVTLSNKATQALASFKGHELSLNGVTSLTDMAVEALASRRGDLLLDALSSISDTAAAALGASKDRVSLISLSSISDTGAISLNNNKSIALSEEMSKTIAISIKKYMTGASALPSKDQTKIRQLIKTADPKKIKSACNLLSNQNASEGDWTKLFPKTVLFKLLNTMDPEIWGTLASVLKPYKHAYEELRLQAKKRVETIGIWDSGELMAALVKEENIDAIELMIFASGKRILHLGKLKTLSSKSADALSKYEGEISLSGLTKLNESVAESLSRTQTLQLGLTLLSDNCVKLLSKHQGHLHLPYLTEFSDAAAEYLARSKAEYISLGLKEISDTAAEVLSKYGGHLCLRNLRASKLSDAASESLSKCKGHLYLSDAAEKSISKKRKK